MLVARRDPPLYSGAHVASHSSGPHATPGVTRLMTVLQVAGSLLAIPVGLASGYSIYHANFSAEARCQSLRANIISMLDKNADAKTLRLLVRRDVAAFEGACATVDPDAVTAFKTLLATDKPPAPALAARTAAPAQQVEQVPAQQPELVTKRAAVKSIPADGETKSVQRDAATSDVKWLAAVRRALLAHATTTRAAAAEAAVPSPLSATRPIVREAHVAGEVLARPLPLAPPVLPAPMAVAPAAQSDAGHPVPPASVPNIPAR